jgi:hypothetical protein
MGVKRHLVLTVRRRGEPAVTHRRSRSSKIAGLRGGVTDLGFRVGLPVFDVNVGRKFNYDVTTAI